MKDLRKAMMVSEYEQRIAELEAQLAEEQKLADEREREIERLHKCIAREWVGK